MPSDETAKAPEPPIVRGKNVAARLSQDEYKRVAEQARRAGKRVSVHVREVLLGIEESTSAPPPPISASLLMHLHLLNRIGSDLASLAESSRSLVKKGQMTSDEHDQLVTGLAKILAYIEAEAVA